MGIWRFLEVFEVGVEKEGYRAVVVGLDLHVGGEDACLGGLACDLGEAGEEGFVEGDGGFGGSGAVETGAGAFAGVAKEGELADDEAVTADIEEGAVEFVGLVGEEAEVWYFIGQPVNILLGVFSGDAEEDEEARIDMACDCAVDAAGGGVDALED